MVRGSFWAFLGCWWASSPPGIRCAFRGRSLGGSWAAAGRLLLGRSVKALRRLLLVGGASSDRVGVCCWSVFRQGLPPSLGPMVRGCCGCCRFDVSGLLHVVRWFHAAGAADPAADGPMIAGGLPLFRGLDLLPGGRWWSPGGLHRCRASAVPAVGPTFSGCRASLGRCGRFRRLSAGSGLLGCRSSCSWAVFGLPALVFCMVGGRRLPAAAFVAVGGLDPAAIYTYTRARRGSCRVGSRSDGEKPVQRYTRARRCCRWCAISSGAGRFGRRAISNGSRKIMKAACNP